MVYDFTKLTNRRNSYSLKWNVSSNELPMWVADMDFETAPEIIDVLHQRVEQRIFGYNIVPEEYYQSIHDWWKKHHHIDFKKDWMIFCTGVVPAISSIVRKITTVGENVLIQSPVYNIFYNSILNNGRHVLSSDLIYDGQEYLIDFTDLEMKLAMPQTTLMILCNPHNPIGKIWDKKTLQRIGDLCAQHHVIVLSDEIHCDIVEPGLEYVPFAIVSSTNQMNSITCVAPTKAFNLAGLQTSCVIIANDFIREKVRRGINTDEIAEPNSFAIEASIAAFKKGEQWLLELNQYISENKQIARKFINEHIPNMSVPSSMSTYLLWLDCSAITDDADDLTKFIQRQTGLYLSSGNEYGKNGELFMRMNVACPKERLMTGLHYLKEGIDCYETRKITSI